jgi:hypothetical protein
MRIGNLSAGTAKLHEAMQSLEESWVQIKQDWNDANSLDFEEKHLQSITPKLKLALDAVNRLADVLARAGRDCE